jgi:hypothetical protein
LVNKFQNSVKFALQKYKTGTDKMNYRHTAQTPPDRLRDRRTEEDSVWDR